MGIERFFEEMITISRATFPLSLTVQVHDLQDVRTFRQYVRLVTLSTIGEVEAFAEALDQLRTPRNRTGSEDFRSTKSPETFP